MKIAILASNRKPIPSPKDLIFAPGVLIQSLVDGLVKRGHEVTLFAPEGTKTRAKLVTCGTKSLYEEFSNGKNFAAKRLAQNEKYLKMDAQYELLMAASAFEYIKENDFDIVHSHKTLHEIYFTKFVDLPCVFTFHDPAHREMANEIDKKRLEKYAKSCYFVSISEMQRKNYGPLNFVRTVYNGIKLEDFKFSHGGETMLFAGRLEPLKGGTIAVEVAKKLGKKLDIVGDVVHNEEGLKVFNKIKENLSKDIKFRGHIPFAAMEKVYAKAKLLLMPIGWEESFGLVMVEAMACGTPVIAFDRGSVREVVRDGETGFIVPANDTQAMICAAKKIYDMPAEEYQTMRRKCREHVEQNFTTEKMVEGYLDVYQKVIKDYAKRNRT